MEAQAPQMYVPPTTGPGWLASRLLNRQVVNAATLEPVGRVKDVVFDPKNCQVAALSIQSTPPVDSKWMASVRRVLGRSRSVGYVTLDHIVSLSGDVVVVDADPGRAASQRVDRMAHLCEVCELAIITLHGVCLGSFADLLVDAKGNGVIGYVVNPAKEVEGLMMALSEIELAPPPFADRAAVTIHDTRVDGAREKAVADDTLAAAEAVDASPAQPAIGESLSHLRLILASSRVRIGDSLIMVFDDVEPLQKEGVVITSQTQVGAQVIISPLREATL